MQTLIAPQVSHTRSASGTGTTLDSRGNSLESGERPPRPRGGGGGAGGWGTGPSGVVVLAGGVGSSASLPVAAGGPWPSASNKSDSCSSLIFWLRLPYNARRAFRSRTDNAVLVSRTSASSV